MAREPFNQLWAEAPTQFEEPPTGIWEDGWTGGPAEDPPEAKWQNWWQNRVDVALRAIERLGAMTWHPDAEYVQGAIAIGPDGERYISTSGDGVLPNSGNDPTLDDGSNWILYYGGGPPGQVSAFAMPSPPAGWLKANGVEVSRSQYSRLFEAIGTLYGAGDGSTTFNLPDSRGEFIRGWDDGRGVDSGRTIGSIQSDSFAEHQHDFLIKKSSGSASQDPGGTGALAAVSSGLGRNTITPEDHMVIESRDFTGGDGPVRKSGSEETRPRNISLLICIKY